MGKTKSKAMPNGTVEEETLKLSERQTNVNKLIERMTSKMEEPLKPSLVERKSETGSSELKRMFSFKRKVKKKKEEEIFENNNDINLVIDQKPLKNCELECCEMIDKNLTDDVGNDVDILNVMISKKDSIDNIIDLIVDKSIKREETLNRLNEDKKVKRPLRRIKSYHGDEKSKKKSFLKMRSVDGDESQEETLMKRLENLEKRAMIFEVGKTEEDRKDEKSQCSNRSEEFEKNMKNVLKETSEDEEGLQGLLKTIERVKPAKKDPEKDKMIAAPKADPIIRNTIGKLLREDTPGVLSVEDDIDTSQKKPIRVIKGKELLLT